jgi:23S rRNA pseudouridine2457 synthase
MRHAGVNGSNRARLLMLNKPYGVLCQFSAEDGRACLKDHVDVPGVYPAGRLDADSEGLLLLTNDGGVQHRIAEPRFGMQKTYLVQVEGEVDVAALERLRAGVELGDFRTRPCAARQVSEPDWLWPRQPPVRFRKTVPTSWLEITIDEGKNRQVRRMTAQVGLPTLRLVRIAIGPWTLGGLAPGAWRELDIPPALLARPDHGRRRLEEGGRRSAGRKKTDTHHRTEKCSSPKKSFKPH